MRMLTAAFAALLALAGCSEMNSSRFRYKMTVEVETPQGLRTGSSVREISAGRISKLFQLGDAHKAWLKHRGEAVAVNMAHGRTLFVLLKEPKGNAGNAAVAALRQGLPGEIGPDWVEQLQQKQYLGRKAVLLPENYPLLVTFADINDPKSVERVDRANLAASFGEGVKLKAITVEVTNEPMTTGIGKRFKWWNTYQQEHRRLNGSNSIAISSNDLSDNIGTGEFSTGVN